MTDPIDKAERIIRKQSGVEGLRAVATFLHALPSDAILTWYEDVWTPATVLAMELEERANAEIDQLRKAKADEWQDEGIIDYLKRENAYLRARQAPVYFMIDRENYSEMIQVFHPLDQKRIGDLIMAQNPPDSSQS